MLQIGITGKNGLIGWHLYNRLSLLKDEYDLIDFQRDYFENQILLDEFVSKCDIIIHLAGVNRHNDIEFIYKLI